MCVPLRLAPSLVDYDASDTFVFRTPLLPIGVFTACTSGAGDESLGIEDRYAITAERVWSMLGRADVTAALRAASPAAADAILRETGRPASDRARKVVRTALRYVSRMTSRATPFALLAGSSVGRFAPETRLELAPASDYARRTRISAEWLFELCNRLTADPQTWQALAFVRNPTAYRASTGWRFIKTCQSSVPFQHWLMECRLSSSADAFLAGLGAPTSYAALADRLRATATELDASGVTSVLATLIEAQLLVADVSPEPTGPDMAAALRSRLDANESTSPWSASLRAMEAQCARWDARGVAAGGETADRRADGDRVGRRSHYQIDLWKPSPSATLSTDVLAEIRRGADVLWRLHGPPERDELARFRAAFTARYGAREVPLLTALDEEDGIGFGETSIGSYSRVLDGVPIDRRATDANPQAVVKVRLLERLTEALASNAPEIVLDASDVDEMEAGARAPLADAFHVMASVAATGRDAPRVWVRHVIGPSGIRFLARFCHVDPSIEHLVRAHVRREEDAIAGDAVLAEVVHVSDSYTANIASRPVLRAYEIPCGARSGAPVDRQIPLADLFVSVRDDRIRVRSATLDRWVIPRSSNAHYYARGIPPYRFLCALQAQHASEYITWRWDALTDAPRLPRVVIGRIVLCRAQWRMTPPWIDRVGAGDLSSGCTAVRQWRAASAAPGLLLFVEGDEELLLDLDNPVCVDVLRGLLHERTSATFAEIFPAPDESAALAPEGRFVHEIVVPFAKRGAASDRVAPPRAAREVAAARRRVFTPGSEWCYAKLYVSDAAADALLSHAVAAIVDAAVGRGLADRWHFVRYGDPERHIRLRLRAAPGSTWHELAREILGPIGRSLDRGVARDVEFASYVPEVERYGGMAGLDLVEQIFHLDSDAALDIVRTTPSDSDERWWLLLRSWDALLDDFGFDDRERLVLVCRMRDGTARQILATRSLKIALGEKFRRHRRDVMRMLSTSVPDAHPCASAVASMARRSDALRPIAARLRDCERRGQLVHTIEDVVTSVLHMSANRVLRRSDAAQDLVLCDMLSRVYDARLARGTRRAELQMSRGV